MIRAPALQALLARLDGDPAEALESQELEFKPWLPDPRALKGQIKQVREIVVCLANQAGGTLVLGVSDKERTRRRAIHGVGDLDAEALRREIYRGTAPAILVDVEDLVVPEGRLLLVHVPRGYPPYSTSDGLSKIRVGKECRPLTAPELLLRSSASGAMDRSAVPPEGATVADLDTQQIAEARRLAVTEGGKPELAKTSDTQLLESLSLLRGGQPTMAAVLLVGQQAALARFVPMHEVTFLHHRTATRYDVRQDMRGPLLAVIEDLRRSLAVHARLAQVSDQGFTEMEVPDVTWGVAREAVLNALVHRDYFLHQSVQVAVHRDRIEITSPGGFPGDVGPHNVLRHPPVRRSPLLADVFQQLGFVNRAGVGVDRIYEEMLRLGKAPPRYTATEAHVRLVLPTRTNEAFARFVAEEARAGRAPELDDLLLLRAATDLGPLDRWTATRALQTDDEALAATRLASLRERGWFAPRGRGRGTAYHLAPELSDRLRGRHATNLDLALDDGAVALRVQAVLAQRGRLTNVEVRELTGYGRTAVIRLLQRLRDEGLARAEGRGRASRWVPGPKLSIAPRSRRRRQ